LQQAASASVEPGGGDEEDGEGEIEMMFRARLSALRRLPRHEKAAALRAAREWRTGAMKALREKRAARRLARHRLWQAQQPMPRPTG
jgi:hypothetical protein